MLKLNLRDFFWLVFVAAMGFGWWAERSHLLAISRAFQNDLEHAHTEVARLKKGPDWAGMDRIIDQYALRWLLLQKRERQLGMPETPNPFDEFEDQPETGDAVPKVPPAIFPREDKVD